MAFAIYYIGVKDNPVIKSIFLGLRPAVVALIAVPVIRIAKSSSINEKTIFISIFTVILIVIFKINPIVIIATVALAGLSYGIVKEMK